MTLTQASNAHAQVAVVCYTFGSCWLYATVFSSTLALLVPLPLPGRPPGAVCLPAHCRARAPPAGACAPPCAPGPGGRGCVAGPAAAAYCGAARGVFLACFAAAMLAAVCAGLRGLKRCQVIT